MLTLEAESAPKLEVTAMSPSSGQSKRLDQDELNQLFSLLTGYEEAQRHDHRHFTATVSQAAAMNQLAHRFEAFGLNIDWFTETPREDQPLFVARFGPFEKPGYCLQDLLGIAREAGILSETPRAPETRESFMGRPADKRVFIVDDDETVREMIAMAVRHDGFKVDAFNDGAAMFEAVGLKPDLLILDLMLPVTGGYEILKQLQMGDTKRIPVIVITGRLIDRDMSRIMRQEANLIEFIEKPLHPKALLGSIHRILETAPPVRAKR